MKNIAVVIPPAHIDALSYGNWDWATRPFLSWLSAQMNRGIKLLVLPTPRDAHEQFGLAFAGMNIRELLRGRNVIVMSEARLTRRGISVR